MRTSTAERNGYRCPKCGDQVTQDRAHKGFVRHLSIHGCDFELGERDPDEG